MNVNRHTVLKQLIRLRTIHLFKIYGIGRLIFDRLVTAELQDMVDPNYRDKKQARLEKLGNGFWWDMNNDEIRLPEVASKDQ